MESKPDLAASYAPATVQLVRAVCLYIATKLGDLRDDFVIVGGLVPSLILPQSDLPAGRFPHIGTIDVDLGLAIAILDEQRYHELCNRLRKASFRPDTNEAGHTTNQRWRIESEGRSVTVDFLIPATKVSDKGGTLRNFEEGFAAVITPGLDLAFEDRRLVKVQGELCATNKRPAKSGFARPGLSSSSRRSRSTGAAKTKMPTISSTCCRTTAKALETFSDACDPS